MGPKLELGGSGWGIMSQRKFSPEFREQAVREVTERSRPIADVARELGMVAQTLGNWVTEYRRQHAGEDDSGLSGSEREELRRLRKEVRDLRMEKEFLGKAAAFFAKDYR